MDKRKCIECGRPEADHLTPEELEEPACFGYSPRGGPLPGEGEDDSVGYLRGADADGLRALFAGGEA